uniref:Basement membrane-specific heparan sulfate proteoglycan core protein-like n=1 Tax=Parastrongyloides trichosuri TaxID=131310 RepID=A0A0N4ZCH2_PARTI
MIYQWRIYKFLKPNYFWLYLLYFFIVYSRTSLCNIVSLNTNDIYDKKEVRYFTPFIGTSFTIKCPLTFNNDYDQIRWIKDDKAIVSGGPIDIITDKLTINFVEPDHTGTYRCLVESEDGTQLSPIIYVYVKYFRKLASMPSSFYQVIRHKSKYIVLQTPPVVGSNEVEVKWTWHHNGHTITPNETHFISNVNGNLIILPTEGIFGNYIVEGDYGSVKEVSSTYKVEEDKSKMPPDDKFTLLTRPRDVIVSQRNNTIIFECMTSSWENVKIDWFLDGKLITRNEWRTIKITEYNRRLTIHEPFSTLTKKNSAETRSIKCRASSTINDKILDYAEGKVTLYDEPIIDTTNLPKIITIGNKTSLKLHCKILKGWPRPKYFWKFNGRDIITTHSGYLKIDPLTDKDMGIYQCDAINSVGSDTATIRVKRFDNESKIENISYQRLHDEVKDSNLYIAKKPVSKAISAGNDITLNCELNGAGETSWKFGETLIKNENNKYTIDGKGLTVHSVQLKDSGDYTCLAKNLNGIMVDEASAVISVISSNIIEYGPSNQSMLIGSNIEMPCKLSADYATASDVSVSWFWNNKIIPAQGDILHRMSIKNDNSLTINQVGPDNIGEYRCKVTTSDGKEEIVSAWLKIIEKPSMPHGVNVELINTTLPTKVKVLWQPGFDGNSPLIKHSIEMRTMGSAGIWSNWETIVENVPTEMCCSALIDNLKPSSTAEFRVVAFNRHGPGKPSIPSKQILIPQQPPAAAPRNVAASARSSTSVMVYWQPPPSEQWNGDILGYNVRYRLSGYATADWNVKNVSNNQERYVLLEPLITWRDYEIQVAAYNDRGLGVYSTPPFVVTTLEGVPLQSPQHIDVDVINSTAVNVSFEAPEQQMVPGQILGYKIEMWKDSFDNGESTPTRSIPLMPAYGRINSVITGLDKFGHYNLTILAFTSAGDGPRSEPKDVITEQDIPGPVKGLNFDQVLFSSVTVLWEPPTEKNGIITHYVVRCWKQGDKNSMKTFDLGPNETSVTIEGLSAQTKFIVDVVAHTEVGAGEIVEAKFESGVPPELPGKATNLRVSAISARTCLLDFIPGFDGHTIIQHWHVEAQIGFSNSFIPIFNISAPKAKSFKITGLRPNTRYIIRLVAENIKGFGAPSLPSDVFFTEKTIPEHPPEKVEAEPQMMNSIQVFWNLLPHSSWNGDLKGYVIQYRSLDLAKTKTKDNKVLENGFIVEDDYEDGADFEEEAPKYFPGKWKEIKTQNTKVSDFIITNLKAYTMYEIQVFAENTIGRSDPSPKVLVKTYENVPSSGPKNVKVDILGGRSINVFWDEVDRNNTNGIILGYIVRLSPEDSKLQKKYNKTIDIKGSNETSVKIVNLKPFTKYNTQVSAYTIVGNGISTFAKPIITPADVPDEPLDVTFSYVSETEVRIKWMPPENANGIISGYSIRYWKHGTSDEDAVNTQIPNSIYWFTATGLIPNTTYYFGVQAQNENSGWGQESIVKVLTTNIRAPQPIPIMLEHNKEMKDLPTDLYFKWNNPNLDNKSLSVEESPVRFVQIEYRSMKDAEFIPLTSHIAVTKRSAVISNLLPNTAYKARMKFIGDFQESPWSPETDWISTSQTYPFGAPTDFSVKPYQSTSVFLQWNSLPAEKWNSDVIGYRIEYKEYPSNGSFKIEELPLTNKISMNGVMTHILSHLTSFKHYIIRIQAFNKIGNSEFSVPKFVFVGYSTPKQKILGLLGKSITPTSITLDWKEWGKFEDDFISGYKVKYTTIVDMTNKEDRNVEEEILITEDNHIVLNDLKKYTEYQISVAGYNRAGDGESSIIRLKTLEGIPGVVSNLKFNNIMTNSVNVKWEEPLEPNGLILGYLVSYHASENNGYNQDKIFRVKENNVVLENLTENVHYKISVKAESIQGFGPSVTSEVRIGYGNPGTPSSPKKPNGVLKNYGILLSWENDKKDGESVTGFVIQGKRLSSVNNDTKENSDLIITSSPARIKRSTNESVNHLIGEWINLYNVNSDDKEYEINYEDLQPSSIYVFRVLQKNDIGVGNPSEESEHILVPAYKKRIIFYKEWWFIPVGAAILALILIFLLILLCKIIFSRRKKNKYVQKRKESLTDHQLNFVENARVNYELSNVNERRHDFLQTRPNTHNSWLSGDLPDNQVYGSIHSGDNQSRRSAMSPSVGLQALYGSLATDKIDFSGDQPTLVLSSFKPSSPSTSFLPNLAPTPGEIYARSRREDIPVRSMYEESVCMETMDQESLEYSTPTPLPTGELPHEQNYYEQCIRRVAPSTVTYASSETYSLNSSKPQSTNHYYTTSYQPRNSTHQGTHSNIPSSSPTSENMSSSSTIQDPGISLRSSIPPSPSTKYKSANLPKNGLSSFV